jgi:uncharacterized membrane protein
MTDHRRLAWTLSKAAQGLPPAERQAFREFLRSLKGAEPRRRKVHSWKRRKKKAPRLVKSKPRPASKRLDPQLHLPLE